VGKKAKVAELILLLLQKKITRTSTRTRTHTVHTQRSHIPRRWSQQRDSVTS
jgi:hypothetical protein